ncbi:transposase [Paracoccus sp. (in: a-proteobacteria)]|uniref:transposase n=1 Tax=Paracoccus sp. TaxID=267 RepID=UPI004057D3AF
MHPVDARIDRIIAKVRARAEHSFRVIKRQFGGAKTRYRGLAKNPPSCSRCSRSATCSWRDGGWVHERRVRPKSPDPLQNGPNGATNCPSSGRQTASSDGWRVFGEAESVVQAFPCSGRGGR